ncbi:ATP-binding protein [Kitasatospora viridis]|uniref:Histidine kinase-like protein n=1 Tax=Kitasatospora viridis TaxID=281105 RepID=A0A561UHZ8_9ACTN|nr:ATP-binding protein [Kitasatospora viridis]TWF98977.1 histidine kinase-like protein [Kitasatospora viridis]
MALMVAREVPTSSTMAVPHGPASVGAARRRLRRDLGDRAVPAAVIDDAVLILSELLSNSCRYARPLAPLLDLADARNAAVEEFPVNGRDLTVGAEPGDSATEDLGGILVRWQMHTDGVLTLEVTDGGAATRPLPARPSLTARGGRGLSIVGELATDWGVRDAPGEVTVWAALPAHDRAVRDREGATRQARSA